MPNFCELKGQEFSQNFVLAKLYENACEAVVPYLGIDPVSSTSDTNLLSDYFSKSIEVLFDPNSVWFPITIFFVTILTAFLLGIYIRRETVVGLLRQKEEWMDREKMLLSQLWAALEEKLESKSMLQEARTTLERIKVELNGERSEKQSLQSRMWGLDRNIKTLQTERDTLEEKLKDCITTFTGIRKSLKNCGEGENVNVTACMDKVKSLESLMKKLIEAHRQEQKNFISLLEKKPTC